MQIFMDEIGARHGEENIFMVLDGASWHRNQELRLPRNLQLLFLPPYAPEFNPLEHLWGDLREKSFHNHVFDSRESLEAHLEQASPTSRSPPFAQEELGDCPGLLTHYLIRNKITCLATLQISNPMSLLWSHAKQIRNARQPLQKGERLATRITAQLTEMARCPALIRSFFRHPSVAYVSA